MTDPADPTPAPIQLQYEVPASLKLNSADEATAWNFQGVLVTRRSCGTPMICIKCGQSAVKDFQKAFYWHPKWMYVLLILTPFWCIGLLAFLAVVISTQKKATIHFGICQAHHRRYRKDGWICTGFAFSGIAVFVLSIFIEFSRTGLPYRELSQWLFIIALVLFLYGVFHGAMTRNLVSVKYIDNQYVYYKGAGEGFLRELPSL